jgi:hypothetical protein
MKASWVALTAAFLASVLPAPAYAESTALDVMTKNFFVGKVTGSVQEITMELVTAAGQRRVRKTSGYTKLQKNGRDSTRVVRFLSPPDVKNTANLMVEHADADDDIWIYLPALKKVRRIVASNKKDSFVGTDFSYGDVIGHKVQEWNHKLLKSSAEVYLVESTPKTDTVKSSSGYSKVLYTIRADNFVTTKAEYWDVGGKPLKTITYDDIKQVDPAKGKWQAMRLEAKNLQTGHRTIISFDSFKLDPEVKEELFTTRYLEKEQ